jgi:hypothetical protein
VEGISSSTLGTNVPLLFPLALDKGTVVCSITKRLTGVR